MLIKDIYEKGNYSFQNHFDSWQDAIRASYEPLLQKGIVEECYINNVIECVNKYGPYIVLVPGIAMPHSSEGSEGCNGTAIAFMKVNDDVDFDPNDEEKKAKLFFSLASLDHDAHLKGIQDLMEVLMDEDIVAALMEATCEEDLKAIIEKFS